MKDPIPRGLPTCEVHKFLYVSCNACYFGETSQHLSAHEHLVSDLSQFQKFTKFSTMLHSLF